MSILNQESKATLNDEAVDRLKQLVQVNRDSASGFQEAADAIEDAALAADFRTWAVERTRQAEELAGCVELNDGDAPADTSWAASLHQTWLNLRAGLNSGDAHVVLIEAERGEDQIKEKYEEVLKDTAGSAVNDALQRQYACVKAVHDRVRDLRDARAKS